MHITISPILGQILSKITQFFQNFLEFEAILAQIRENFACIYMGSFICQEADFATHVGGTSL